MKNSDRLLNRRTIRTPLFTGTARTGAVLFIAALYLASNALPSHLLDGFIYVTSGAGWPEEPTATDTAERQVPAA
ncbi:hypothetical protein AB833_11050 [Chromatiales bacterium (ex Bugula neritina AB1)]|nr:hypothetical protein AB833_11050 [Chromatiales bacterium (ex Bugula neritina AB1)]